MLFPMLLQPVASVLILALGVVLAPTAIGQDRTSQSTQEQLERFQLYRACRPMRLAIEHLSEDATKIGLTREALRALARVVSKLRGSTPRTGPECSTRTCT